MSGSARELLAAGGQACVVYTQDDAWQRRLTGFLRFMTTLRHADTPAALQKLLAPAGPILLLMDMRAEAARDVLPRIRKTWPQTAVIAFGIPRSDPLREADAVGVYASEDLMAERQRIQGLVAHALDHVSLLQENEVLRGTRGLTSAAPAAISEHPAPFRREARSAQLISTAFRHMDDVSGLLHRAVESVAHAMMVLRCGVFAQMRPGEPYRVRAGLRCSSEVQSLEYEEAHPLAAWLETHTQLISRPTLEHVRNASEVRILRQALDETGAEVILPLIGAGRLLGWLFVGPRSTGLPFVQADLEDLVLLAEPIATALENALIYAEASVQKTLLETLLNTLPTGIVAFEADGVVRWLNRSAQDILNLPARRAAGQAVETLGTKMADAIRRALRGDESEEPAEWTDPSSGRSIRVQTCRLGDRTKCLGAVALVQDVTIEQVLQDKEEEVERTAFWAELAASMSHEIRNPLVAIRTFAQLLPERYADPEFRNEFSDLVAREVDRLNAMVDEITRFAYPPKLAFTPLDIRRTVQKGLNLALVRQPENGIRFEIAIEDDLPPVSGDEAVLSECFAHLFSNAMEAVFKAKEPRIVLNARRAVEAAEGDAVLVTIADNGGGIPAPLRPKIFSPFCTSKARGMGLGLPIVKRTVTDHNGRLQIDTDDKGTSVSVLLPAAAVRDNAAARAAGAPLAARNKT
ncbi:MAG: PAS domain-containing protein [Kiritimatiellae bacterium]|nr:PAS domain-containing protein [Kiritimatiellia bacterium]